MTFPPLPSVPAHFAQAQIVAQWSKQELLQSPLEKTRGPIQISTVEKRPEEFESNLTKVPPCSIISKYTGTIGDQTWELGLSVP